MDEPEPDSFDEWDEVVQERISKRSRCCLGSGFHKGTHIAFELALDF